MCCKQHSGKEATKAVASFFESFFCEGMKRGVPQVAAAPFRGAGSSPPTGTANRAGSNARARCGTEYLGGHVLTANLVELRVEPIRRSDTSSMRDAITSTGAALDAAKDRGDRYRRDRPAELIGGGEHGW